MHGKALWKNSVIAFFSCALALCAASEAIRLLMPAQAADTARTGQSVSGTNNKVGQSTGQSGGQTAGTIQNGPTYNAPVYNAPVTNQTINHATIPVPDRVRKLLPGNEQRPPLPCGMTPPKDALVVLFGGGAVWWQGNTPKTILTYAGVPILILGHDGPKLTIDTLRIYDDKPDIIVRGEPKGFWKAPNVRVENPNKSTLVAYDHVDNEVLRIHFLNKSTILVQGVFRTPNLSPSHFIVANQSELIQMPNHNRFAGFCAGGNGGGVFSF